jgi:cyanate permease
MSGRNPLSSNQRAGRLPGLMLSFTFFIGFILHLLLFATAPMVSIIMEEMNLSHAEFGMVYSASMLSLIIFRIPWGIFGDRKGYLLSLRVALPLIAASSLARTFSPNFPFLLGSQIFLGLGLASVFPCLPMIVKEWSRGKSLGFATGVYISGFAAGNAAALGITPPLLAGMGWRSVLLLYSCLSVVLSLLWWGWAKSSIIGTIRIRRNGLTKVIKDPLVWVLLLFMSSAMGSYDTLATWMPKVLEMKNIPGALASLLPLGFFFAGPVVGWMSDRLRDRKKLVFILGLFSAGSIAGINFAPLPYLPVCIFLAGFSTMGVLTLTLALPAEIERFSSSIGTVIGLVSSLGNMGPLIMPVVFGWLIDLTRTFQASVFFVALVAGATFLLGAGGVRGSRAK